MTESARGLGAIPSTSAKVHTGNDVSEAVCSQDELGAISVICTNEANKCTIDVAGGEEDLLILLGRVNPSDKQPAKRFTSKNNWQIETIVRPCPNQFIHQEKEMNMPLEQRF